MSTEKEQCELIRTLTLGTLLEEGGAEYVERAKKVESEVLNFVKGIILEEDDEDTKGVKIAGIMLAFIGMPEVLESL